MLICLNSQNGQLTQRFLAAALTTTIVRVREVIMASNVIITRHAALVEVLRELVPELDNCEVIAQATPDQITGKHVYGVLPLHLAALAECVTTVTLNTPAELRGTELSVEQVKAFMGPLATYRVEKL